MRRKNSLGTKLSIIIVYYGGLSRLVKLLDSIEKNKLKYSYEIILVNNKTTEKIWPKLRRKYPKIKYVVSFGNIGYARGNNLGASMAKGEYLFIINPDTVIRPKALNNLVKFLDTNKKAGIVAPNLIYRNGKLFENIGSRMLTPIRGAIALSFINKIFPSNPISRAYYARDLSKDEVRELDSVPGTALLIRRNLFEKLKGFDSNFFLYFEESDLCKRVIEHGFKIYAIPNAEVEHDWKPAEGGRKFKKIFEKSRYYYFKKHFGVASALFVELFTRISKVTLGLLAILALAIFLRIWKLDTTMPFIGDFAWYYNEARKILSGQEYPLVGIPSSVPVLKNGVLWTYLLSVALKIGNFSPLSGGYLSAFLSTLGILAAYFAGRNYFSRRVGIITASIAATFPFIVFHDRMPFQTTGIFLFSCLFAILAREAISLNKYIYYFWLGLVWGLLFQLELSSSILLPILIGIYLIKAPKFRVYNLLAFAAGCYWGTFNFFVSDFLNGVFIQTIGFAVWFITKLTENIYPILGIIIIFGVFNKLIKLLRTLSFEILFVGIWLLISLSAFLVRGVYSEAYLPLMYFPLISLISLFINFIIKLNKDWGYFILIVILSTGTYFSVTTIQERSRSGEDIAKLDRITDFLIKDSNGKAFSYSYIAPGADYESTDDNWDYLFWYKKANVRPSSGQKYVIIDRELAHKPGYKEISKIGSTKIEKKVEK